MQHCKRKRSYASSIVIWTMVVFCFSAIAEAQEQPQNFWILTNPEAPFVVQDDKRKLNGFLVDIVEGILQQANIRQKILAAPWERVEREARTKSNVLVFALARTQEREDHYYWITPLTSNVFSVYAHHGDRDYITDIKQLKEFDSIAVLKNDVRHKLLLSQNFHNIRPFENWPEVIEAVVDNKTSAMFFSDAGVGFFCATLKKDCSKLNRVFMYQKTQSYLVLSKVGTDPELARTLSEAAKTFKQSDQFSLLAKQWLNRYKSQPIPMHMENGVLNIWQQ